MAVFMPRTNKNSSKASEYFIKLYTELDMDKYNFQKYKDLFMLSSFQAMHDTDLAYYDIYFKCAQNAHSKDGVLGCLANEEQFTFKHPDCFDNAMYRRKMIEAIAVIRRQVTSGSLDYLFM
jgi:hypothetical protein